MKDFEINPLDVLEKRKLDFLPPHLEALTISYQNYYQQNELVKEWIVENLKGRFYIGSAVKLDDNRLLSNQIVAFEDTRESTIFFLACPHLAKNKV